MKCFLLSLMILVAEEADPLGVEVLVVSVIGEEASEEGVHKEEIAEAVLEELEDLLDLAEEETADRAEDRGEEGIDLVAAEEIVGLEDLVEETAAQAEEAIQGQEDIQETEEVQIEVHLVRQGDRHIHLEEGVLEEVILREDRDIRFCFFRLLPTIRNLFRSSV